MAMIQTDDQLATIALAPLFALLLVGSACGNGEGDDAGDAGDTGHELSCTAPTCMPGDRQVEPCGGDAACEQNTYRITNRCNESVTCQPPMDTGTPEDASADTDGGGDTMDGGSDDTDERCSAPDEVYVPEACEMCGSSGGCEDRGPACRNTCGDTGCESGFSCNSDDVCVRACL